MSPADLTLQPIDTTAQLTDGTTFDGVAGLKHVLQDHSEEFVYTMTDRLLTYALGRGSRMVRRAGYSRRGSGRLRKMTIAFQRWC